MSRRDWWIAPVLCSLALCSTTSWWAWWMPVMGLAMGIFMVLSTSLKRIGVWLILICIAVLVVPVSWLVIGGQGR
jgi:hypothetical protein